MRIPQLGRGRATAGGDRIAAAVRNRPRYKQDVEDARTELGDNAAFDAAWAATPWKPQLADTTYRVTRTLRLGALEELFGKAAEQDRFATANPSCGGLAVNTMRLWC